MHLEYKNKLDALEVLKTEKAKFSEQIKNKNILIQGDNLTALSKLLDTKLRFDLCYIDPPFATGNIFKISNDRASTISKSEGDRVAYSDKLKGADFIEFLRRRIILIRELLTDEGSFYIHTDYKIGHYIKIMLDEIFGIENFKNDISRIKCNPKNFSRKAFGNVKDLILFYTKTKNSIWNEPSNSLTDEDINTLFKKIDKNGRRYNTVPIHAPGETKSGATSQAWKGLIPPKGRHWRCSPAELDELDKKGLIEWSSSGNPRRITFADEHKGKKLQDIWTYKDPMYPQYPTEKNFDLLKLIINASTNEKSIVLDAFCGGGTTLAAAELLGRRWVGIDMSKEAIKVAEKRIKEYCFMNASSNIQKIKVLESNNK